MKSNSCVKLAHFVYAIVSLILIGTAFYHFAEGLSFVDAFYFSAITITTVGFGDFYPQSTISKLFTAVYSLVGVSVYLYFITLVASHIKT